MATRPKHPGAERFLPPSKSLPALTQAALSCQGCDLHIAATQTVFGEGPSSAKVVFVGEQPGNEEDRQGRPFVGPAGRVFDEALQAAGLDRSKMYVTNAVKHFSFEQRGKVRLHKRPNTGQVKACAAWLRAELEVIRPHVLVLMGATAAQSLLGPSFRITTGRGRPLESDLAELVLATIHPSAVLRSPDPEARERSFQQLVTDLRLVAKALATRGSS